ncbi:MAG: hypothetical protein Q8R28_15380 [Dehalococcoidia bacterium]|nr:hypothetical protein [Dehalococcoidia bacterium]
MSVTCVAGDGALNVYWQGVYSAVSTNSGRLQVRLYGAVVAGAMYMPPQKAKQVQRAIKLFIKQHEHCGGNNDVGP